MTGEMFNEGSCWICRRLKDELDKLGVNLIKEKVGYEIGKDRVSPICVIEVCVVCNNLIRESS